jgi:hypothetical protein
MDGGEEEGEGKGVAAGEREPIEEGGMEGEPAAEDELEGGAGEEEAGEAVGGDEEQEAGEKGGQAEGELVPTEEGEGDFAEQAVEDVVVGVVGGENVEPRG